MAFRKPKLKAELIKTEVPNSFFTVFKKDVNIISNRENRKFATAIKNEAKNVIYNQKYNWKELSEGYAKFKEENALDDRIYIAEGDFVESIGVYKLNNFLYVGPNPFETHRSGLSYILLARVLEFGSHKANIPARPLWRPLLSSFIRRNEEFKKIYASDVKSAFKKTFKNKVKPKVKKI